MNAGEEFAKALEADAVEILSKINPVEGETRNQRLQKFFDYYNTEFKKRMEEINCKRSISHRISILWLYETSFFDGCSDKIPEIEDGRL